MTLKGGKTMKLSIFIDKEREEEVIVYTHKETELVEEIRNIIANKQGLLLGYSNNEIVKLNTAEIECFFVESNKVYALKDQVRYRLKERLYQLESQLPDNFIKINQSCIANIDKIQKFDVSFSGSLTVIFKSGYHDYVSRRNMKKVKERLGL